MIGLISGANSRALALLYLACVLLSLTASVVGPPERNFNQGQPELQQAMDNLILHDEFMKKSVPNPSSDDMKASSLLNNKATHLLDEAENMLSLAKDMREKAWLENFVHKLKTLASILEQNIANHTREKEPYSFVALDTAHDSSALNGHLPLQNSTDAVKNPSKTVPETRPGQMKSNQATSKLPLTHPEKNLEKSEADYATIDHVTKPGIIPPLTEKVRDELVEELESLHKLSSLEPFGRSVIAPETSSKLVTEPPSTTGGNVEQEKEKLKERIANEVAELKKLGETEENILNAIHIESYKAVDSKPVKNELERIPNEHETVKRVLDEANPPTLNRLPENYGPEPPKLIYMNNTFSGMHINLPPVNPRVLRRQFHYGLHRNMAMNNYPHFHGGLKGTIHKLQTHNNPNFLQRNHMYGAPHFLQQGGFMPQHRMGGMNPYGAQSEIRSMRQDNPMVSPYVSQDFRPPYRPFPQTQNVEQRSNINSSWTTYPMGKEPTELTGEMKRQLRDGKVILLSDNIVSTNYTSDKEKEEKQKVGKAKAAEK